MGMWTNSISLKEEKKYLDEIKELKRSKPKVSKLKGMEAEMENRPKGSNTEVIRAEIQKQSADIKEAKEQKRLIAAEYAKLNEERQKLQTLIQDKIAARNKIRDEFREKEKEFNAYMNEIRKIRAEKAAEARNERQAEMEEKRKQRQVEQLDEQPHVAEITLLEQTIAWCKSVLPKETKESEDKAKAQTNYNNPDGAMILLKKDDREEEFYYAPTKKKAQKGKKKEDS